jgi:Tol biopolymer transport system component
MGVDSVLTATRRGKYGPHFSRDGARVAFSNNENYKYYNVYVISTAGGPGEVLCENCGQATDWSDDGKYVLGNSVDGHIWLVEPASRRKIELLADSTWRCCGRFTPNARGIEFPGYGPAEPYVVRARFHGERKIPPGDWAATAIPHGEWSPKRKVVYFLSDRDGYRCIWGQRVDDRAEYTVGPPFTVYHAYSVRHSLKNEQGGEFAMSVAADKLVFNMGERAGNIWMAEWRE